MDALTASGIDLCQFPAGTPPDGTSSNFINPPSFAPAFIAVSVIMMASAILFTAGRLFANFKEWNSSDYLCLLALIFSLGQGGMLLAQLKYMRHQWDIPVCWLLGDYAKVVFSQALLLLFGLFFSKTSLLLLLRNIFDVNGTMKWLIWIGLATNFATYFTGIPIEAYYNAPSPGQSWYSLMISGKPDQAIYWGLVQSSMGILLDLYIFMLPLPILYQLNLSKRKRIHVAAIFSTAFLGVVANVVSLVYRVLIYTDTTDQTWKLYAIFLCTIVELNLAIVVCSMPGVAKFFRLHGDKWVFITSLWSKLSTLTSRQTSEADIYGPSQRDSLMTGPAEPAIYRPQKPLAPPLAYHPAPHYTQPELNGVHRYHGLTGPIYYSDSHFPQTETNGSYDLDDLGQ